MVRRAYIFRNGVTDACALIAARDSASLPTTSPDDGWRFWMQIGPLQAQGGRYGFDIRSALPAIAGGGYYLFTGSPTLLGRSEAPRSKGRSNDAP
jgi:hypothetical protein